MKFFLIAIMFLFFVGCTDAQWSQVKTLGNSGHVRCYSGGKLIYDGWSTGKTSTESQSDGWYLRDKATDKLVRVSGDCLIEN